MLTAGLRDTLFAGNGKTSLNLDKPRLLNKVEVSGMSIMYFDRPMLAIKDEASFINSRRDILPMVNSFL
jgi:hypothetical protein